MTTQTRDKTDLVRERPEYFHARAKPVLVELRPVHYLTLAGGGAPTETGGTDTQFQKCVRTLYAIAYAVKRHCKKAGQDFKVPALQATWLPYRSFGDGCRDLQKVDASNWRWKLMIMVPDYVAPEVLEAAKADLDADPGEVAKVRLQTIDEGLCVQALHVGPYREEHHTIFAMREFIERTHLRACGLHHEVYLNDPNRTPPEKLRVILRQPVRRVEDTPCPPDEW